MASDMSIDRSSTTLAILPLESRESNQAPIKPADQGGAEQQFFHRPGAGVLIGPADPFLAQHHLLKGLAGFAVNNKDGVALHLACHV